MRGVEGMRVGSLWGVRLTTRSCELVRWRGNGFNCVNCCCHNIPTDLLPTMAILRCFCLGSLDDMAAGPARSRVLCCGYVAVAWRMAKDEEMQAKKVTG